jgi:hypothetical protein
MSLAARSIQGGLPKPQDENPRFAAKQAKPAATTTTRRVGAVLSDITNVGGLANTAQAAQKVCLTSLLGRF